MWSELISGSVEEGREAGNRVDLKKSKGFKKKKKEVLNLLNTPVCSSASLPLNATRLPACSLN